MRHKFLPKVGNKLHCALCNRPELDHSDTAQCETCANKADCEIKDDILMCVSCRLKEESVIPAKIDIPVIPTIEHLTNQIDRIAESSTVSNVINEAVKENIQVYTDFFNAKTVSIKELEDQIASDSNIPDEEKKFELARILNVRVKHLTKVLFDARTLEVETSAEIKSIQTLMNTVIPKLRKDMREQFAASDAQYVPQQVKEVKAPKVRLSTADKLAENYSRLMKIPLEQAKKLLGSKMKEDGIICSCSATPGLCRVHNV